MLPDEPGGYSAFQGLFGAASVNPFLTGQPATTPLTDLLGAPITDPFGQPGFPGFDGMSAATSLAYTAAMQEKGVPVTFAYISDAHDFHGVAGNDHQAFGAGGRHFCLGTALARLELKMLFEETLKRFPAMQLAGEPRYVESPFVNQLKALPVRLHA